MTGVDPITQEVITEGLAATMAEMRANVMRSAYSTLIALVQDFSCGLFDPSGQMIAQGPDHPGHIVPLPWGVRVAMEDLGGELEPGDVIMFNDPYRGGTHLNDVTVLWPVFLDDELFVFPAVRAHWADIGGISPGSYSGEATNIHYEGVRIPPLRIYRRGELNEAAFDLLLANVRLPEERRGDFLACVGACAVGERRILEMVQRYGRRTVEATVRRNLDRAEQRMRTRIGELPDGEYLAEDYLEFFSEDRLDPGLIALRLRIDGDRLVADFTRSSPQLPGVVNSTAAVTLAGVVIALKSALDPSGQINSGTFRPVECRTEPGSIVDVRYPAPANAHGEVRKRTVGVTLAALAQAAPRLVSGDLCGTSFPNLFGGWDDRRDRSFVYLAAPAGGNGGVRGHDGPSALGNVDMGDIPLSYPVEEQESVYPIEIEELAVRPDSEGPGRFRGGLGVDMRVAVLAEEASYSLQSDRAIIPPWGVLGGGPAGAVSNHLLRDGEVRSFSRGKVTSYPLREGDRVRLRAAGGGGYEDPLDRDPQAVREDVREGYVSAGRAAAVYGVVLRDGRVDAAATEERRATLRTARHALPVVASDRDAYDGVLGSHRVQYLHPALADRIGVREGDLIELTGPRVAAVRAWTRLDPEEDPGCVPLDELGRRLLRVDVGDEVELRVPPTTNPANDLAVGVDPVRSIDQAGGP